MTHDQLSALLVELLVLLHETGWGEWKHNNTDLNMIGQRVSASRICRSLTYLTVI